MVDAGVRAIYRGAASGETSWIALAQRVFELGGHDPARVRPTTSDRFPQHAPRPGYSVLSHGGSAGVALAPMRDWREAVDEAWPLVRNS